MGVPKEKELIIDLPVISRKLLGVLPKFDLSYCSPDMKPVTLPSSANLPFVEKLYAAYRHDPSLVSEAWREYFTNLGNGEQPLKLGPTFHPRSIFNPIGPHAGA